MGNGESSLGGGGYTGGNAEGYSTRQSWAAPSMQESNSQYSSYGDACVKGAIGGSGAYSNSIRSTPSGMETDHAGQDAAGLAGAAIGGCVGAMGNHAINKN